MQGVVFDIQRYAVHDGPGIRTLVFLKGCPLRCKWCSNPESQDMNNNIMVYSKECIGMDKCQECRQVCKEEAVINQDDRAVIDRERCTACGECAPVCYVGAIKNTNRVMSSADVVRYVEKDIPFYNQSGGGVTLSGGEPTYQYDFALELVQALKKKHIHVAIETTGYCAWDKLERIAAFTDLFLYDIKHMDSKIHKQYTGVDNQIILDNVLKLKKLGADIKVRIPLIPGINDQINELTRTAAFVAEELNIREVSLLPYHRLGQSKYEQMGREYELKTVVPVRSDNVEYFESRRKVFANYGINIGIGD